MYVLCSNCLYVCLLYTNCMYVCLLFCTHCMYVVCCYVTHYITQCNIVLCNAGNAGCISDNSGQVWWDIHRK